MLRSLVEVLPFMVVPKWVSQTLCQPVAISDVLDDLVFVLNRPEFYDRTIDIGGPDVVTYQDDARARERRRVAAALDTTGACFDSTTFVALGQSGQSSTNPIGPTFN